MASMRRTLFFFAAFNLIFALESEFNVDIPDEEARSIRTVRQMAQGIAQLLAQKAPEQGVA